MHFPAGQPGFGPDGFHYWPGASGRRYIHSVYKPSHCPPLPGAIYLAVRQTPQGRAIIATGQFSTRGYHSANCCAAELAGLAADEIHVHLLAPSADIAALILADLREAHADAASLFAGSGRDDDHAVN